MQEIDCNIKNLVMINMHVVPRGSVDRNRT